MDFSNFIYHKSKVPSKKWENEKFFSDLKDKFVKEISQSDLYKEYKEKYNEKSVEGFINAYATIKSDLCKSYDYYFRIGEKEGELKFRKDTENAFRLLKQKKLFNLQLQWRAEKIKLDGVKMCEDFAFWGKNIDDCHFLPKITEHEVTILKEYIKNNNGVEEIFHYHAYFYQNYYEIMEKDEKGLPSNMPDFYDYYDTMMGTSSLLLLPDKRGPKEEFYHDLNRNELHKKVKNKSKNSPEKPKKHLFSYDLNETLNFAEKFETDNHVKELFRYYKILHSKTRDTIDRVDLNEAIRILDDADEDIIMPGGKKWQDAIVECANRYKASKIVKELNIIYEEYVMFYDLGIKKGLSSDEIKEEYENDSIIKLYSGSILNGRALNNEPRDFNF